MIKHSRLRVTASILVTLTLFLSGTGAALANPVPAPPALSTTMPLPPASSICAISTPKPKSPSPASPSISFPKTITLLEETELYDDINDHRTMTRTSISPQTVEVVDRAIHYTYYGELKSWYKIRTWLGEKWILSNTALPGDQKDISMKLMLTADEKLYEFNTDFHISNATISPQTVTAKAEWQGHYLIETWLGDRWISPGNKVLTDMKIIDAIIPITENTELFTAPDESCSTNTFLKEHTVYAYEQWDSWIRIKTNQGTYWINPKLAAFDIVDSEGYIEAKVLRAEKVGNMTKLLVQARLTDKLKEWNRPLKLVPSFTLYDDQGGLLDSNIGVGPIEFKSNEIIRFELQGRGDLTSFKLATAKVYTLNGTNTADSPPYWNGSKFDLILLDPKKPEVLAGEITATKSGAYSIVRGKIQVALPDLNDLNATLTFYNDKDDPIGSVTIKGTYGDYTNFGHTTYRFESIGKGDLSTYKTVKLTVNSLIKPS